MNEWTLPPANAEGVRRAEFPLRVKLFFFWVSLKLELWVNERNGKFGVRVL
jgi:hypothetical protein